MEPQVLFPGGRNNTEAKNPQGGCTPRAAQGLKAAPKLWACRKGGAEQDDGM